MALLGLLIVASLFAADGDDLQSVKAYTYEPTTGNFFDCASITLPSSNPTPEQRDSTIQKCIDTKWCLWTTTGTGSCYNDLCLKYLNDSDQAMTDCTTLSVPGGCTVRYLTDGFDCSDYSPIQTDRFCRATDVSVVIRGVIDECFYGDLKSIGQERTGSRLCTGATCSNKTSSAGGTCAVTGSDCSLYDKNTDEYCGCLTSKNCDLYPGCFKNTSSTCIYDQCTDPELVYLHPATAQGTCLYKSNDNVAASCKLRPSYTYSSGNTATVKWGCVNKDRSHANECYGAIKSTVSHPTIPGCDPKVNCNYCDTVTVDESICTTAQILDKDSGAGIEPSISNPYVFSDTVNCTLVDIAEKWVGPTAGKYCTDGDRDVPAPDAANLVRVSSSIAFGLMLLVAVLL